MKRLPPYIFPLLAAWMLQSALSAQDTYVLTESELKGYDAVQRKRDPEAVPLLKRLQIAFPGRKEWTGYQVEALERKGGTPEAISYEPKPVQKGPAPKGTFTAEQAANFLAVEQKLQNSKENLLAALHAKYGINDWYTREQVDDIVNNGLAPRMIGGARKANDPVYIASQEMRYFRNGFLGPKIRETWQDVLYDEDPSQPGRTSATIGDLTGATFSYTHSGTNSTDTWNAKGSLILPWQYQRNVAGGWGVEKLALAPSISFNRIDTSGSPDDETDELLYRLGAYANWRFPTEVGSGFQFRAAAVYATDFGGEAELPGYELEIEPRWNLRSFPLGYRRVLIQKHAMKEDGSDISALDYQLRTWFRLEGGDVQNSGGSWGAVEGDFLRMGPTAQLRVTAPGLIFDRDVSLTALYSRLFAADGPSGNDNYFKATVAWTIYENEYSGSRISVNLDYQNGELNMTRDDVETVTLGLGILF